MRDGSDEIERDLGEVLDQLKIQTTDAENLKRIIYVDPASPGDVHTMAGKKFKSVPDLCNELYRLYQNGFQIGAYEPGASSPHLMVPGKLQSVNTYRVYDFPEFSATTAEDMAKEPVPPKPSGWNRFLHTISFGLLYRDKISRYTVYEKKQQFIAAAGKNAPARIKEAAEEAQKQELSQARKEVEKRTDELAHAASYQANMKNRSSKWNTIDERMSKIFGPAADPPKDVFEPDKIRDAVITVPKGMSEKDCTTLIASVCMSREILDQAGLGSSTNTIAAGASPEDQVRLKYNHNFTCMMENVISNEDARQKNLHTIFPAGRKQAAGLLSDFAGGNPKPAGTVLGAVIKEAMYYWDFTAGYNSDGFKASGAFLERSMELLEHHPEIAAETGLQKEELRKLHGILAQNGCQKESEQRLNQLVTNPPMPGTQERRQLVRSLLADACILTDTTLHKRQEKNKIMVITPEEIQAEAKKQKSKYPLEEGQTEEEWVKLYATVLTSNILRRKENQAYLDRIPMSETLLQKKLSEDPIATCAGLEKSVEQLDICRRMNQMDVYELRHVLGGTTYDIGEVGKQVLKEYASALSRNTGSPAQAVVDGNHIKAKQPAPEAAPQK